MLFRYEDVKKTIEEQGGKFVDALHVTVSDTRMKDRELTSFAKMTDEAAGEYMDVILFDESKSEAEWNEFCKSTLGRIGLEKLVLTNEEGRIQRGFVLKHWNKAEPVRPKQGQLFVRCNSPTESMAAGKKDIFRHVLGMKSDMLCFDYRGTWKSEGHPSEGGYYLDAEAAVDKAVHTFGYDFSDIWAEGFCLGAAVAHHLKHKYHEKGINLFTQNAFDRLHNTLHCQVWPASAIAHHGISKVMTEDPEITQRVRQDGFDNVSKLRSLKGKGEYGTCIFVNTDTDTTSHADSMYRLGNAADLISQRCFTFMFEPDDRKKNGHSHDVLGERIVWDQCVDWIASKDIDAAVANAG